jgi:hypothetical protein
MTLQRHYLIHLFGVDGYILRTHQFRGPDDLSALQAALTHCNDYRVEVWQGPRCVVRLAKGCEAA